MSNRYQFTLFRRELEAIAPFMSRDESRWALNGVRVKLGSGAPLLVATDGRRLLAFTGQDDAQVEGEEAVAFTMSRPVVELLLKANCNRMGFEYESDDGPVVKIFLDGLTVFELTPNHGLIDLPFPNWRQVVPRSPVCAVPHVIINGNYLGDFHTAATKLFNGLTGLTITFHGALETMQVNIGGVKNFLGLVMPVRSSEDDEFNNVGYIPDWAKLPPPPPEQPATPPAVPPAPEP